jgi:ribosomal-protein-alanine N-acetyltransferase
MVFYLETERLIMRDVQESDLYGMFTLDSDPLVHKYLGNNPIKTRAKAAEIIQFIQKQYRDLGIGRFAAIEKSSREFIGWSGLKLNTGEKETLNGKTDFYDIGFRFIPGYWGKGYATESSVAVLDFGFNKLNLKTICGAAEKGNLASNKVLQKIGLKFINEFTYDTVACNWYELNKDDYAKKMS